MANRLKMAVHQSILGLASLNWSYRRIAAELGVDRETVSRHVRSARAELCGSGPPRGDGANAAIVITGSGDPGTSAVAGTGESNAANVITGVIERPNSPTCERVKISHVEAQEIRVVPWTAGSCRATTMRWRINSRWRMYRQFWRWSGMAGPIDGSAGNWA